jgi:hypothetical protein
VNGYAGLVLSDIATRLPPTSVLIGYGDDLLVLARAQAEADEIKITLCDALHEHRVGSLRLKHCVSGDFRHTSCEFLGYEISCRDGEPRADISCTNELKVGQALRSAIANDCKNRNMEVPQTRAALDARLRSFHHWPDLESFRAAQIENAKAFVETERMTDAMFIGGIDGRRRAAARRLD